MHKSFIFICLRVGDMKSVWHFNTPGACELCECSFFYQCAIVEQRTSLTSFGTERACQIFWCVRQKPIRVSADMPADIELANIDYERIYVNVAYCQHCRAIFCHIMKIWEVYFHTK